MYSVPQIINLFTPLWALVPSLRPDVDDAFWGGWYATRGDPEVRASILLAVCQMRVENWLRIQIHMHDGGEQWRTVEIAKGTLLSGAVEDQINAAIRFCS